MNSVTMINEEFNQQLIREINKLHIEGLFKAKFKLKKWASWLKIIAVRRFPAGRFYCPDICAAHVKIT